MNHLLLFFWLLALILVGCADHKLQASLASKPKLEIIGEEVTSEQVKCIKAALSFLPAKMRQSLRTVHIRNDAKHFEFEYNGQVRHAAGHNCQRYGKKICIRPEALTFSLIWHEISHVFTYLTENSDQFTREWQRIAGDVYVTNYEDYYNESSSEGLMTYYSRKSYLEDIAEFVEHCYCYLYFNPKISSFENKNFKKDRRYRQKLALLHQYGFFSDTDYQKLKPLFE